VSNPFERLRSLARWSGDDDDLAAEAALALAALAGDPGLVVACRRMLAHHPMNARLWWLLAHVLAAPDPNMAARSCRDALDADRTADRLAAALPLQGEGERLGVVGWTRTIDHAVAERSDLDVVAIKIDGADPTWSLRGRSTDRTIRIIEPWECSTASVAHVLIPVIAIDDRDAIVPAGVEELIWEIGESTSVWLVGGLGVVLPRQLVDALWRAVTDSSDEQSLGAERLDFARVTRIVGSRGAEPLPDALMGYECPLPAELLRPF
jgi:hypothetical protein